MTDIAQRIVEQLAKAVQFHFATWQPRKQFEWQVASALPLAAELRGQLANCRSGL